MATAGGIPSSTGVIFISVRHAYIFVTYLSSQRGPTHTYPCVLIVCIDCYIRPFVQQYPHSSSSPYHSADRAYRTACHIPPFVQQYSADFPCLLLLILPHPNSFTTARCVILSPHYLYNNSTRHSYPSPPSAMIQQFARLLKVPPPPSAFVQQCSADFPSPPRHFTTPLSTPIVLHATSPHSHGSTQRAASTRIISITTSPHSYSSALQNCHTHITTMLTSQSFSCHTVLPSSLHHPFTHPLD